MRLSGALRYSSMPYIYNLERFRYHSSNEPLTVKCVNPLSPALHVAVDQYLMERFSAPACFVRTNIPSVVIGRHQLAIVECNLDSMKRDKIELVKRPTGGGAVYLDNGNCMVGMTGSKGVVTKEIVHRIMTTAIDDTFQVKSQFTGKNDIAVYAGENQHDKFKVAGLAYKMTKDKFLAHACILVNANISNLPLYLTPNQKKLASHHTKSVDQRVKNLVEFNSDGTVEMLGDKLMFGFDQYIGKKVQRYHLGSSELLQIDEVREIYERNTDPNYIYENRCNFNVQISEKFPFGFVELYLAIDPKYIIQSITVNTDAIDLGLPSMIKENLIGNTIENCKQFSDEYKSLEIWLKNELNIPKN